MSPTFTAVEAPGRHKHEWCPIEEEHTAVVQAASGVLPGQHRGNA